MSIPLSVLIVEDSEDDALLLLRELRKGNYSPQYARVETRQEMEAALEAQLWDIIIADYNMPNFGAMDALKLLQRRDLAIPFIIVSGAIGEDVAATAMRAGAQDYLMKGNLTRLVPAIERELEGEKLRRMQKLESLGILAGGVAHDFNNLLVAILGQSSVALSKLPPHNPARVHIEKIVRSAERAADLAKQMLAYSGHGGFEIQPLNLNDIVKDNLHLLEAGITKTVIIEADITADLPLVDADPGQIQQVVMNAILNAAEAIGNRPGQIRVSTSIRKNDGLSDYQWPASVGGPTADTYVALTIADNGPGMDKETLLKIFDPFFTTKSLGRGLGLAAVLGIVRGHKGGIKVVSELGRGTTFKFLFPSSRVKVVPKQTRPLVQNSLESGVVLVIDDEEPVREAVTDILEPCGVQVLTANSGESGLDVFRQHQDSLNLIILDLSMPGMNGEETFRELRKIDQNVNVILSSGYHHSEISSRFAGQNLAGFLQKPYNAEQLTKEVMDKIGRNNRVTTGLLTS